MARISVSNDVERRCPTSVVAVLWIGWLGVAMGAMLVAGQVVTATQVSASASLILLALALGVQSLGLWGLARAGSWARIVLSVVYVLDALSRLLTLDLASGFGLLLDLALLGLLFLSATTRWLRGSPESDSAPPLRPMAHRAASPRAAIAPASPVPEQVSGSPIPDPPASFRAVPVQSPTPERGRWVPVPPIPTRPHDID